MMRGVSLLVESGPDAGQSARLDGPGTIAIGADEGADLRLRDELVSRHHARLTFDGKDLLLIDDGSRNGTWVGTMRISRAVLTADTRFGVGKTVLSLRIDAEARVVEVSDVTAMGDAIGVSPAMRHVFSLLERASPSDVTVLLEGESGVGKEVLARAIHTHSARANEPFVIVDCGAIPATLVESELFGHERGAFTGAATARTGLFEQADGGTIFLDEIGELPIDMQPKLLRVLEAREVRPVGSTKSRTVNVRVVAATNRNLAEEVKRNTFRSDLYYRLAVARVRVPPLRDRPDDIPALANAFYRSVTKNDQASLPEEVIAILRTYPWPGNARELRNVVQRYTFLGFASSRSELFDAGGVPQGNVGRPVIAAAQREWEGVTYHDARQMVLDEFEQDYIPNVLARASGVVARAAELAGVARPSFYRMVERLESRARGRGER